MIDKKIFMYGMPRSGSTFIRQVLERIFTEVKSRHEFYPNLKGPIIVYRDFRDVMASHWRISHATYQDGEITNKMDLRFLASGILDVKTKIAVFERYSKYRKSLYLRYEDFFENYDYLFGKIEEFFDIKIENKEEIIEQTDTEHNKQISDNVPVKIDEINTQPFDSVDKETELHKGHIYKGTPGLWKEIIPPEYHDLVSAALSESLEKWGYEI